MQAANTTETLPVYNYTVVRQFTIMTIVWGIVGMLVGVLSSRPMPSRPTRFLPWPNVFGTLSCSVTSGSIHLPFR